jgi:hypothetical protein
MSGITDVKPIFKPGDSLVEVEKRYGGVYPLEKWSDLPEGFYYNNESDMLFGTSDGPKELEHVNLIKPRSTVWSDYWSDLHKGKFTPSYDRSDFNSLQREKIMDDLFLQIEHRKEDFYLWLKETGFDQAESEDEIRYLRDVRSGRRKTREQEREEALLKEKQEKEEKEKNNKKVQAKPQPKKGSKFKANKVYIDDYDDYY